MQLGNFKPVINSNINLWILVLFVYCYFASVMPVNILLQPRDYLSSFLLFFGVGIGYIGLFLAQPKIMLAPVKTWSASEGYLWPMLFVTIACGAASGFHALIASGTSSKQIASERHIKRIGYGGMVAEGLVAVLAIVAASVLLNRDQAQTPIGIYASGYASITEKIMGGYGGFIAITILNAFILTTLDTATRISRYLTEELFGLKNRYLSTLIIIALSAALAFSGKWQKIWPAFGASNQLVASLALFVLSCWLLSKGKPAKVTIWPAFFMLVTTVAALIYQAIKYFTHKEPVLFIISVVLMLLSAFMVYEIMPIIFTRRKIHA